MNTSKNKALIQKLSSVWGHIGRRRRAQICIFLCLTLLSSFAEIFSIGIVLPFLAILTTPEQVLQYPGFESIVRFFGVSERSDLITLFTIAFSLSTLTAVCLRIFMLRVGTRLSFAIGADLSIEIYRKTLYQPYAVHCARNSSEIISGLTDKMTNLTNAIDMSIALVSSSILLIVILTALVVLNPIVSLVTILGFGIAYALIVVVSRERIRSNSQRIAIESTQLVKLLQEGLGGIRDILIDSTQEVYCQMYRRSARVLRSAQGSNVFIGACPRYVMEAVGMIAIAILAYLSSSQSEGVIGAIPLLGTLALGAQRLLPVLQQVYSAWTNIAARQTSIEDCLLLLDQKMPDLDPYINASTRLEFAENLTMRDIRFQYEAKGKYNLGGITFTLAKGSRMGLIGRTGSGKSTLLDVLMGLLTPVSGEFLLDGQALYTLNNGQWQSRIAHVPQSIFLADSSIEANIAFGVAVDQIDHERVIEAAEKAQLTKTIEQLPGKYQTIVGERGVRLSGGQRQRIGIARALYKKAEIIIFDEATSALDSETEAAVMQSILNLSEDLTMIIVAHRLSTLKDCEQIIELADGSIKRIGTYAEIIGTHPMLSERP